jgi:hypothetical protein
LRPSSKKAANVPILVFKLEKIEHFQVKMFNFSSFLILSLGPVTLNQLAKGPQKFCHLFWS